MTPAQHRLALRDQIDNVAAHLHYLALAPDEPLTRDAAVAAMRTLLADLTREAAPEVVGTCGPDGAAARRRRTFVGGQTYSEIDGGSDA